MAVVDYLGTQRQDLTSSCLKAITVTEDDPERFGTRDLRHVRIYGLTVVAFNPAAATKNALKD
jgi:hypothetical protein